MKPKEQAKTVIATIDKDLDNTPGWHYNWNKGEMYWVSEGEATKKFYTQLLTGDKVDNIQGIPGIGPKKAEKVLEGCETEEDYYYSVLEAYHNYYDNQECDGNTIEPAQCLSENAQLLWMIRELDEDGKPVHWEPPV